MELCDLKDVIEKHTEIYIVDSKEKTIIYRGNADCMPFTSHKVILVRATGNDAIAIYVE